jgi:hypothetical protein
VLVRWGLLFLNFVEAWKLNFLRRVLEARRQTSEDERKRDTAVEVSFF